MGAHSKNLPEKGARKRSKGQQIERQQVKPEKGKKSLEVDAKKTSTRLCIKNIPPSFTSVQLRDYLKKEYRQRQPNHKEELVITDCRVLMHPKKNISRRIAFAGFQSHQMAQRVVDLFHQTFAMTSRLSVEFAHIATTKKKDGAEEIPKETIKKESKVISTTKKDNSVKSLLIAGAGSNKAKFWSNDLDLTDGATQEDAAMKGETPPKINTEELNDDVPMDSKDDQDDNTSGSSSDSDSSDDEADPLAGTSFSTKPKMSDLDFLKSKQKMVEDLDVDDPKQNENEKNKNEASDEDAESSSDSDSDSDDKSTSTSTSDAPTKDKIITDDAEEKRSGKASVDDLKAENDKDNAEDDENSTAGESSGMAPDRLFVRNLPFSTTEEHLEKHFERFGPVLECHIPVDDRKVSKGFAFVTFQNRQDAAIALEATDGSDFQGRFLHVMYSRQKPKEEGTHAEDPANHHDRPLSYKERQELARRQEATKTAKGWSASFVRGDAVVDSLADRLGLKKGDILNVKEGLSSGDAAVRLALGETQVIEENRVYFKEHGVDMEALVSSKPSDAKSIQRSTTSILVKNLPYDTLVEELNKVFHGVGEAPKRILLPPSRTIALVEYSHSSDAKRAFRRLAYRRFKSVPLYLEWAPIEAIESTGETEAETPTQVKEEALASAEEEIALELDGPIPSIYVKNLNFSTTEEKLHKFFQKAVGDVRAVKIPTKLAPVKKPRASSKASSENEEMQSLSMGFGFVEFATQEAARKAITKLQGCLVDGHALELKPSTKSLTEGVVKIPATKKNPTKITVRNVPFQASRTEILKLFGSFGQLKRVRLPKKFNGGHRGFAFVEFVTHKEALAAMKALSRTHLYGRHLVLEWAEDESEDGTGGIDTLRQKAQRDVQANVDASSGHVNKRQKLS